MLQKDMIKVLKFTILFFTICFNSAAQSNEKYNASEIQLAIKKLNVLGSVLYIAAHPDDENTRLITYFSKEQLYNTAYLSLTRGDGGQNLIGPELNELLGVIRTQELLQARKIDGGKQFFSRAKDFGFSKIPDETFRIWDREKVLADMVWVIRKFRPDVMITRFNTEPGKTHGHHTASAILAQEAFEAAADKSRFPEQLQYVEVWQAKRLLWNTNWWFYGSEKDFKTEGLIRIDVGEYNQLLGESCTEIAAKSRSMHKSQGFGAGGTRGTSLEYLEHTKGPKASKDIFEDINSSWSKLEGGDKVNKVLQKAYTDFKPEDPSASIDILLEAKNAIQTLPESHWKKVKLGELQDVIKACLGLFFESVASQSMMCPGQQVSLNIEMINRSGIPVEAKRISYKISGRDSSYSFQDPAFVPLALKNNISNVNPVKINLPGDIPYTQPYWLKSEGTKGMFKVDDQNLIGLPENPPAVEVIYSFDIKGHSFTYTSPLVFKKTDPVKGEQYSPFEVTPSLFINPSERIFVFGNETPKMLSVKVKAGDQNVNGILKVVLPEGWKAAPASFPFSLKAKGAEADFSFKVFPSTNEMTSELKVIAEIGTQVFDQGLTTIKYDHIPAQALFPKAVLKLVKLNLKRKGENIGYIMGAGDEVPAALAQVGYKVSILKEENIKADNLKRFDAVIMGIRAYNTQERLKFYQKELMTYTRDGGTLIVQYNTLPGRTSENKLVVDSIGPYPFKLSNERVTEEDAAIRFINPGHPLLNTPNKITDKDFENWIQERGLYFPNEWSKEYETILSCNDTGETPKDGGILVAKFGKGNYIYTSYSWFRELPSGVPGAYRIFTNLISIGK
jgi:LmbE family N-acetylglucosaminyl deacetylase